MTKKYRFVKIELSETENNKCIKYPNWFFVANNWLDVIKHTNQFGANLIEETTIDIIEESLGHRHFKTDMGWSTVQLAKLHKNKNPLLSELPNLYQKIVKGKFDSLDKGFILLIRDDLTYMTLHDIYKITDEYYSDKLIYNKDKKYTEKNIRIIKFPKGKHYYAKIDNIDVVDEDGNQKWNTKEIAMKKAISFLKTL